MASAGMASVRLLALALLVSLLTFPNSTVQATRLNEVGGRHEVGRHKVGRMASTPGLRGRRLHRLMKQAQTKTAVTTTGKLPTYSPLVGRGSPFLKSPPAQNSSNSSAAQNLSKPSSPVPSNAGYRTTEEISKPISRPRAVTPCNVSILTQMPFNTYAGDVTVSYSPPSTCNGTWQLVVVSVAVQVTGVQFDRRFAFFLDNLPIVVATTAEPTQNPGVNFKVERDITSYSSFLSAPHGGHVVLQNPVDSTYTGIYYVNVTIQFYPGTAPTDLPNVIVPVGNYSTGVPSTTFTSPPNAYKAAVELYISHYGSDEFYYDDVPMSYYNSLPSYLQPYFASGTAFREIVLNLDGSPVGVIFPKAVFYSGALDPRLWSPFMGIGSLNMLLYTLDITPFVGLLLDGKQHNLTFGISYTESASLWVITGAIKIWTDPTLTKTSGGVVSQKFSGNGLKEIVTNPGDVNTNITTWASRSYQFVGYVVSSMGRITTNVTASLSSKNIIQQYNNFNALAIHNENCATSSVVTQYNGTVLSTVETSASYPFDLFQAIVTYDDGSYSYSQGVSHVVQTSVSQTTPKSSQSDSINNQQSVQSVYGVSPYYSLVSYSESTAQSFKQKATTTLCTGCQQLSSCYARDVASQWLGSAATSTLYINITKDVLTSTC